MRDFRRRKSKVSHEQMVKASHDRAERNSSRKPILFISTEDQYKKTVTTATFKCQTPHNTLTNLLKSIKAESFRTRHSKLCDPAKTSQHSLRKPRGVR